MGAERRGSALLEATVALTVLAFAGAGLLGALRQTRHAVHIARETERRVDRAAQELERLVRFDRTELDSIAGWSSSHGMLVRLSAIGGGTFEAAVFERPNAEPILETVLYRRDTAHVHP